jgi:hypothetical protein
MERVLTCSCGEKILVSNSQAGQTMGCPACGSSHQVPSLRGLESLPLAQATVESIKATNVWAVRGPIMALCLAGMLVCGAYAGYQYYGAYQMQVPFDTEMHIQEESKGIDNAGFEDLLAYWDGYSKIKLTKRMPTIYKVKNDFAAMARKESYVAGAASLVLGALALATFVSVGFAKKKT